MSSLRIILQRCARSASLKSILRGTPLQIQCASTFIPVYSHSNCISRHAYSGIAYESSENVTDSAQKSSFGQNDAMLSPNVAEASKAPIFDKNLNLRKYYINIFDLSQDITSESLREFYSQFGEIAVCKIVFPGEPKQFGNVAFLKKEAMNRALNSLPHCIDGKEIKNVRQSTLGKKELTLLLMDLSPNTTKESLKNFYSKFGWLNDCWIKKEKSDVGQIAAVTFSKKEDLHRALEAQPHVIDGSEVFLQYATHELDFSVNNVPEGITEEDLIAFYSKYGQLRQCRGLKGKTGISHAYLSYSAIDEINRAMDDRPHIIGGKPLKIESLGKGHIAAVSLFVGSLPENVTEETLRQKFSKYGKLVYWKLNNDGHFNQSGPYGIVSYGSEEEAHNALNNGPHTIEGSVVDVKKAKEARNSFPKEK